jgi:hypothetical protein
MRTLIIEFDPTGDRGFNVTDDCGRHCGGGLTTGEMLEMVIKLAVGDPRRPQYPMLTDDEWAERTRQREERMRARQAAAAASVDQEHADHVCFGPIPF